MKDEEILKRTTEMKVKAFDIARSMARTPMPGLSQAQCDRAIVEYIEKEQTKIAKFIVDNVEGE